MSFPCVLVIDINPDPAFCIARAVRIDNPIIKMLKTFPEETYARLAAIMAQASSKDNK
jgi:hypothetical protein